MTIAWPKKGDKFFSSVGGPYSSCINWLDANAKQNLYASAFESAAIALLDGMIESRLNLDTHIYPVVFCFRHSLELRMKDILKTSLSIEKVDFGNALDKHDLSLLWRFIKDFIEKHFIEEDKTVLNYVDECMKEITMVDRISMAFRYPEDLNGNQHLAGMKYIDTLNLKLTMKATFNFFGGIESVIDEMVEYLDSQQY